MTRVVRGKGVKSKAKRVSNRMYAVAVRDDELFLILRIRRDPKGDVYVLFPREEPKDWDPHTSYHRSGQHHQKNFGHEFLVRQGAKPGECFRGTVNLVTIGIAADEPRAINTSCKAEQFSEVLEIPINEIRPEKYRTHIAVDLAEPGAQPIILPGARILQQKAFQDAVPWILVTLFEDTGP